MTFASVHDCFWTHASDVDALNRMLREEFVNMYSDKPILEALVDEFKKRYKGHMVPVRNRETKTVTWRPIQFPPVPKVGTFNVSEVLNSTYFFH